MIMLVSGSTRTVRSLSVRWGGPTPRLGHLLTPANRNGMASLLATGLLWAADNGAFSGLDEAKFRRMLAKIAGQPRCLFLVVPDVVGNAQATHFQFEQWWDECHDTGQPLAYVGQDGAEHMDIPWGQFQAFFVGGSTAWKLSAAAGDLCAEAKRRGKHVHMGRVNSLRRMDVAAAMGCDSIDGSSASMYGDRYIHRFCAELDRLHKQQRMFMGDA